jgi:hypothetical protein
MPRTEINDAAAAKPAPDPSRHLPGFVEFFPRQALRRTDRASEAIKQGATGKSIQVMARQTLLRGDGKRGRHSTLCHAEVTIMKGAMAAFS